MPTPPRESLKFELISKSVQLPKGRFDVAVSALVINFVRDLKLALRAMRTAAPGGTVAAYVWDYAGSMRMLRRFWDAAGELDSTARERDEGVRFSFFSADHLEDNWRDAGFSELATRAIHVPTVFQDFDDYWEPFLRGEGP